MFVTSYTNPDFTNLLLGKEVRKNKKVIIGLHNKNESKKVPHLHQSPDLFVIKSPTKKNDGKKDYYEMELPICSKTQHKSQEYAKYLNTLDSHIRSVLDKNKEKWFEKDMLNSIMYKTIIRTYKIEEQTKFNVLGGIKIRFSLTGDDAIPFYDENKKILKDPITTMVPFKTYMKIIFHEHSILIDGSKCALVMVPVQIKLSSDQQPLQIKKDYSFHEDSDNEDEFNEETCDNYLDTELPPEIRNKEKEKLKGKEKEEIKGKENDEETEKMKDHEKKKNEKKIESALANKGKEIFIEHSKSSDQRKKDDENDDNDDVEDSKEKTKGDYDEDGNEIDDTTSDESTKQITHKEKHKKNNK